MNTNWENLVFGGGGVLGISYLGVLEYLYQTGNLQKIKRVAGTSAGAITACITSFDLPFYELKKIVNTLDYKKVPGKEIFIDSASQNSVLLKELEKLFDDYAGIYRLLTNYGWFSSAYLYQWIQEVIASQFDSSIKKPPYTFSDFKQAAFHKNKKPFLDLYMTGTSLSYRASRVFSFETTPDMEVAEAVRISMSIPLFFESVKIKEPGDEKKQTNIFCDGGIMWNYPIQLFDSEHFNPNHQSGVNPHTLGVKFLEEITYHMIDNLLSYIKNLYLAQMHVQQDMFKRSPEDVARSIMIDTGDVSVIDFDIETGDETYRYLYRQGYAAAKNYHRLPAY